jgi:hypothetical protein
MKSFMIFTPWRDTVWVITSRGKMWVGHVTHVHEKINAHGGLMGKPDGKSLR